MLDKVETTDDLVTGAVTGDMAGRDVPPALSNLPLDQLRWDGGLIVDASTFSTFYIDDQGRKHIMPASGRQELTCQWDDELSQASDGTWGVKSVKEHLLEYLADKRWKVEVAGTELSDGTPLPTDRDRRAALKQALDQMKDGVIAEPINLSLGVGIYVSFTQAELDAVVTAITNHVQTAFDVENQLGAQVIAGTVTTEAEIDAAGWPGV